MKRLRCIFYLLIAVCYSSFAQEVDTVKIEDAVNKICLERGHVMSGNASVTLAYCPPYLVENDSVSYMVYPSCNETTQICQRCGMIVKSYPKELRVVIWRKE